METLVGVVVLAILAMAVYQSYSIVIRTTIASRSKIAATLLANEEMEIARNLPYADVGIVGGNPSGKIPADQAPAVRKKALLTSRVNAYLSGPMLFGMLAPSHYGAINRFSFLMAMGLGLLAIWASIRSSGEVGKLA